MKYIVILLVLLGCSKDISFDPTTTIGKEILKLLYDKSIKEKPVME
jgi:hypothetical protein